MKKTLFERSYKNKPEDCDDLISLGTLVTKGEEFSDWEDKRKFLLARTIGKHIFIAEEVGGIFRLEKDGEEVRLTLVFDK